MEHKEANDGMGRARDGSMAPQARLRDNSVNGRFHKDLLEPSASGKSLPYSRRGEMVSLWPWEREAVCMENMQCLIKERLRRNGGRFARPSGPICPPTASSRFRRDTFTCSLRPVQSSKASPIGHAAVEAGPISLGSFSPVLAHETQSLSTAIPGKHFSCLASETESELGAPHPLQLLRWKSNPELTSTRTFTNLFVPQSYSQPPVFLHSRPSLSPDVWVNGNHQTWSGRPCQPRKPLSIYTPELFTGPPKQWQRWPKSNHSRPHHAFVASSRDVTCLGSAHGGREICKLPKTSFSLELERVLACQISSCSIGRRTSRGGVGETKDVLGYREQVVCSNVLSSPVEIHSHSLRSAHSTDKLPQDDFTKEYTGTGGSIHQGPSPVAHVKQFLVTPQDLVTTQVTTLAQSTANPPKYTKQFQKTFCPTEMSVHPWSEQERLEAPSNGDQLSMCCALGSGHTLSTYATCLHKAKVELLGSALNLLRKNYMGESAATSKQISGAPEDPEECPVKEAEKQDDESFSTPGSTAEPEGLLAAAIPRFYNGSVGPRITERVTTLGCTAPWHGRKLPVAQSASVSGIHSMSSLPGPSGYIKGRRLRAQPSDPTSMSSTSSRSQPMKGSRIRRHTHGGHRSRGSGDSLGRRRPSGREEAMAGSSHPTRSRDSTISNVSVDSGVVNLQEEAEGTSCEALVPLLSPKTTPQRSGEVERADSGIGGEVGQGWRTKYHAHPSLQDEEVVSCESGVEKSCFVENIGDENKQHKEDENEDKEEANGDDLSNAVQGWSKVWASELRSSVVIEGCLVCCDCGELPPEISSNDENNSDYVQDSKDSDLPQDGKLKKRQMQPYICDRCQKVRRERREAVLEFVNTEMSYGEDLRIIRDEFQSPIQTAGLLSPEQSATVFSNLEELLEVNTTFTARLEAALARASHQDDVDYRSVRVGEIFLECLPMLAAFRTYCMRQVAAGQALAALEREKELLRIFLDVSQKENPALRRMHLRSFLMSPLQRVTKYPLLLSRLAGATGTRPGERAALLRAKILVQAHLEQMDRRARRNDAGALSSPHWRPFRRDGTLRGFTHPQATPPRDLETLELREMAAASTGWGLDETRFVLEGRLQCAQPGDSQWVKRGLRALKFQTVHTLLLVLPAQHSEGDIPSTKQLGFISSSRSSPGSTSRKHREGIASDQETGISGSADSSEVNRVYSESHHDDSTKHLAESTRPLALEPPGPVARNAAVVLVKERGGGRYVPLRDPIMLRTCVVVENPESLPTADTGYFELQDMPSHETLLLRQIPSTGTTEMTQRWLNALRHYTCSLGEWRRRRNAFANVMIAGNHV
uniref:uncharacterized protein n=1 Tax=Myxine glutinosa TaxID=7769 RepID=UPI00358E760C